MDQSRSNPVPQEIADIEKSIARWRRERAGLCPMPEELWQRAAQAAKRFGVSRVASRLSLGHNALKRRALETRPPTGGFVELQGAELLGFGATVLELSDPSGTRLTLRVPVGAALDVGALVAAFRRAQP